MWERVREVLTPYMEFLELYVSIHPTSNSYTGVGFYMDSYTAFLDRRPHLWQFQRFSVIQLAAADIEPLDQLTWNRMRRLVFLPTHSMQSLLMALVCSFSCARGDAEV